MTTEVHAPDDYHDACEECGRAYYHAQGCSRDDFGERSGAEPVQEDRVHTAEERAAQLEKRRREDFRARRLRTGDWVFRGYK